MALAVRSYITPQAVLCRMYAIGTQLPVFVIVSSGMCEWESLLGVEYIFLSKNHNMVSETKSKIEKSKNIFRICLNKNLDKAIARYSLSQLGLKSQKGRQMKEHCPTVGKIILLREPRDKFQRAIFLHFRQHFILQFSKWILCINNLKVTEFLDGYMQSL